MQICVLASGSSGNACLVKDGDSLMLVDAGISGRALAESIRAVGCDPARVSAIWLTHEHGDHVRGAAAFAKRFKTPILATAGTLAGARRFLDGAATQAIDLGAHDWDGVTVTAVPIPHDTRAPVCYRIDGPNGSGAVATDMGQLDDGVLESLEGVDVLVWESNHDPDMLWQGPYPEHLKHRISGGRGHLPNHEAAKGLRELARGGLRHAVLAHLSETNNRPKMALAAAKQALASLRQAPVLHLAERHQPTGWVGGDSLMTSLPQPGRQMTLWDR